MSNKNFIDHYKNNLKIYFSMKNKNNNFLSFLESSNGEMIFYFFSTFLCFIFFSLIAAVYIVPFISFIFLIIVLNGIGYKVLETFIKNNKFKKLTDNEKVMYNYLGIKNKNIEKSVFEYTLNTYDNKKIVSSLDDIIYFVKNNNKLDIENLLISKVFFLFEKKIISESFFIKKIEFICNEFNYNNSQQKDLILKVKDKIENKKNISFDSLLNNTSHLKVKF